MLTNDENTILARIRYPDRSSNVIHGHLPSKRRHLVLGIASVARPPGVEYLTKSLHRVIESLDNEELSEIGTQVKILVQNFTTRKQFPKI